MPTTWKNSVDLFTQILQQRGLDPGAIGSVDAAWAAFQEFVQVPLDGVEPAEEDGDGFIVQWGQWSWNDGRPALVFTRQLAVDEDGDCAEEHWQPQLWAIELQMIFAEDPTWADLDEMAWSNSGFDFNPIGPERAAALAQVTTFLETLPQICSLWRATPAESKLSMDRTD